MPQAPNSSRALAAAAAAAATSGLVTEPRPLARCLPGRLPSQMAAFAKYEDATLRKVLAVALDAAGADPAAHPPVVPLTELAQARAGRLWWSRGRGLAELGRLAMLLPCWGSHMPDGACCVPLRVLPAQLGPLALHQDAAVGRLGRPPALPVPPCHARPSAAAAACRSCVRRRGAAQMRMGAQPRC